MGASLSEHERITNVIDEMDSQAEPQNRPSTESGAGATDIAASEPDPSPQLPETASEPEPKPKSKPKPKPKSKPKSKPAATLATLAAAGVPTSKPAPPSSKKGRRKKSPAEEAATADAEAGEDKPFDPADDYDPDSYFSIDSPSSNYCLVFVYQVEIDTQVAVEEQLEHYRKLYSSAVETSFQRWGAYQGQGVELTGKLFGTPGGVRVFSHSGEDHGFTIVECFDKSTLSMTRPGFRLIEGSFKIVSPNLPDEAMAALPEIGPRREDHYLHPRQEELLNQAKRLAAIPGSLGRPYFDSDGRLVAVGPREIRAVSKGANQAELLHQCEDWFYNRSAAHLGDRCFYTTSSGAVFEVLDDHSDAEPAGFDAALIAPLDDRRILLVRRHSVVHNRRDQSLLHHVTFPSSSRVRIRGTLPILQDSPYSIRRRERTGRFANWQSRFLWQSDKPFRRNP